MDQYRRYEMAIEHYVAATDDMTIIAAKAQRLLEEQEQKRVRNDALCIKKLRSVSSNYGTSSIQWRR